MNIASPYTGVNSSFKMFPALAPYGRCLDLSAPRRNGTGSSLFFYDYNKNADASKPVLVLVHGLGDEADSWRHIIPLLGSGGHRVIAIDLPGFGRSIVRGRINLDRHAQALINVVISIADPARPPCSVILAGNSMGGAVIQAAAAKRPDLVSGLILIDGGLPVTMKANAGSLLGALPILGSRWYRAFRKDHEAAYQSLFGYYGDFEKLPQDDKDFLRERVIARVESNAQERAYLASLRSMIGANISKVPVFAKNLQNFPGKVLILWGENDRIFPAVAADPLRKIRPEAVFKVIGGSGHLPQQEKPKETAEAILEFC
jgi:pimeloyl-ACP methyl ester carboxylesterase